jgi:hypothetical protein
MFVWGITLDLVGAVFADYSSYDTTLQSTAQGGVVGCVVGLLVAIAISRIGSK